MDCTDKLIPLQGGFRKLKSFQISRLVYDVTVRFCNRFIGLKSRTHDQMVQAARSSVQNIAEGSQGSGTSKKYEIKLTNVARASLEEVRLDYEDFLRHRSLPIWKYDDLRRKDLIQKRFTEADQFARWVLQVHKQNQGTIEEIAANGVLALLAAACSLLDRQIAAQERAFKEEGGFTERLYRFRKSNRQ